MNKQENPQAASKKIIEIDVVKSDLKRVLAAHKRFAIQGKNVEGSVLSWINFKISDDELILSTTDGTRALVSKIKLIDNFEMTTGEFNLSMALVAKLSFIKGQLDQIRIKKEGENVEFSDVEFNSTQKLTIKPEDEKYPNVEKVLPQNNNFTVTVSQRLIKDIASMKAPLGSVDLSFDLKNNLAAILVETNSENVSQQAILMPIDKLNQEAEKEAKKK